MSCFFASLCKDLLILWRDRAGMLVLFVMPMVLVLVVSLVQNNVMQATGQSALSLLWLDQDQGEVARQLRERLETNSGIELIDRLDGRPLNEAQLRRLVAQGEYQFGLLLPEGLSERFQQQLAEQGEALLAATGGELAAEPLPLELIFDPTVQGVFRTAVEASLRHALLALEMRETGRELSRNLNTQYGAEAGETTPALLGEQHLLQLRQQVAGRRQARPNAVQQNVPAWSLFGMFFIVVPLSGALLRERQEGTLQRLLVQPVLRGTLLTAKICAYAGICLLQFCLMLLVGRFVLPLLGTEVLTLGDQPFVVFLLALCAALAATGYGLLVGVVARSYEQASMFGAVSVVIAAALGGVMVPTYVMPQGMQLISAFSPLAWGLNGFLELFVRGGGLAAVGPSLLALLGFFLATTTIALLLFHRRGV